MITLGKFDKWISVLATVVFWFLVVQEFIDMYQGFIQNTISRVFNFSSLYDTKQEETQEEDTESDENTMYQNDAETSDNTTESGACHTRQRRRPKSFMGEFDDMFDVLFTFMRRYKNLRQ